MAIFKLRPKPRVSEADRPEPTQEPASKADDQLAATAEGLGATDHGVSATAQGHNASAETEPNAETPPTVTTAGPPAIEAGGVLTVDLGAIKANWRLLADRVAPVDCAAVVKADAYGCGIRPVATALAAAGCKTFFVAHLAEAREVRAAAPEAVIYVLNGIPPGSAAAFADVQARPVIGCLQEFAEWDAFCGANAWKGGAALHFDTGMNRLGLGAEEASALAVRTKNSDHGITLVMSHLACAETPDHPLNNRQVQLFRELRMLFRGIPSSLANSSGIFLGPFAHCDLVRPGIALYGINPTPAAANPMQPVIGLVGRIVQIRTIAGGETVGYGAAWTAERHARIATVSIGYADGYLHATSPTTATAEVGVGGIRCPVIGRISMDLLAVDISRLPEGGVRRGDFVTLIGGDIGVGDLARWSGNIPYEVLTSLGRRFHRIWKG
jgi:alanine racemase